MKVYKECCKNCLLSPDSIVSPQRRKDIIRNCVREQSFFICHKASQNDEEIMCRTYYEKFGHTSQMLRIAERLNCVEFVEQPEHEKLPTHREMTNDLVK